MQIALDGPSASGKSTVGAMLAERLGCDFLDTGMMYRAVTYIGTQNRICLEDSEAFGNIAANTSFAINRHENGDWRLCADGQDVTDHLYSEEVNFNVSPVSALPAVRRSLVRQQRDIASAGLVVMAGRDIGTVVLPDAHAKFFLTASAETRAERRTKDTDGQIYQEVLQSIERRDKIDSSRADSPLRAAEDAVTIVTDGLTAEEVVEEILTQLPVDASRAAAPLATGGA